MSKIKTPIEFLGKTYKTVSALLKEYNVLPGCFYYRFNNGYSIEQCIFGPNYIAEQNKDSVKIEHIEAQPLEPENKTEECIDNVEEDKSESTISSNINTKYINSVYELITELSNKPDIKKINFIDFENVNSLSNELLISIINDSNNVNIFFYNACLYSNQYHKLIRSSNSINFQVLTYESGNQLIDSILIYYFGGIYQSFPDKDYNIISKDTGFSSFTNFLNNKNINVINIKNESCNNKKYSIPKNITDKKCNINIYDYKYRKLAEYIVNNHYLNTISTYLNKKELKIVFRNFFKMNSIIPTDNDYDNLIAELIGLKFVSYYPASNTNDDYYIFEMSRVDNYMKETNKNKTRAV